ncbi:MAG: deoxyribonuclease V [Desulfobacterales bacterium]|jgi:deoxyribonuclease V
MTAIIKLKLENLIIIFILANVKDFSLKKLHRWDLTPQEAIALQTKLSQKVIQKAHYKRRDMTTVAGVDTAYRQNRACAAVVVYSLKDLKVMEEVVAVQPTRFPYIPGLLSFREGPVILEALSRLKAVPDILMFDGQGIAHPRRCGLASHIGLLTGIPAIGCAKTRLIGDFQEPQSTRGSTTRLTDVRETVGAVVRTRTGVKPVFVSIGHRMDLDTCIRVVLKSCRGYRLPEPLRRADHLSRKNI